jgi:uncharacterized protein YodC (DUF2158 family)
MEQAIPSPTHDADYTPEHWIPNPGDVVGLASGGPDLTVLYLSGPDDQQMAAFSWFTAVGDLRSSELPVKALVPRPTPPASSSVDIGPIAIPVAGPGRPLRRR